MTHLLLVTRTWAAGATVAIDTAKTTGTFAADALGLSHDPGAGRDDRRHRPGAERGATVASVRAGALMWSIR